MPTPTDRPTIIDADIPGQEHRTLVLCIKARPDQFEAAKTVLVAVRSGLRCANWTNEPEIAWSSEGPFEVDAVDEVIVEAIAQDSEGRDMDENEPHVVYRRAIRAGARAITGIVQAKGVAS